MLDYLKENEVGAWKIKHFEVDKEKADYTNMNLLFHHAYHRKIHPGTYTGLYHNKRGVIMSDTPAELRDLRPFERMLESLNKPSLVRIHGLGLGIAAKMAQDCEYVDRVDVVEIDPDVIQLVGSQLEALFPKLYIMQGNALQKKTSAAIEHYDLVWHDIWDDITLDNWEEYKFLHRRWGHYCTWQGSWGRDELEYQLRQDRRWTYI